MKVLNVRCCCQPQKILGTLPVPASVLDQFKIVERAKDWSVHIHEIKIRQFVDYSNGSRVVERAIYSDDRPVEFWRKISGFVENKEAA